LPNRVSIFTVLALQFAATYGNRPDHGHGAREYAH
jgi:hypothetical protein